MTIFAWIVGLISFAVFAFTLIAFAKGRSDRPFTTREAVIMCVVMLITFAAFTSCFAFLITGN